MRLITYVGADGQRLGALVDGGLVDLQTADSSLPLSMKELLALGEEGLDRARKAIESATPRSLDGVRYLAPIPDPQKVICVGLNYADHAREGGREPPNEPVIFCKFPTAVAAHEAEIRLPKLSHEVDYEAELVVVIGREGRDISRADAMRHVAGYCVGNDVSARDWQARKPGGQWLLGKSFDSFAPFGPALVTADEVANPNDLGVRLRLNGAVMQDSRTSQFLFPIDELIAYVSAVCTLLPGDVLFTGTPPGVGMARKPPVFLQDGDVTEVEIDEIGLLRNRFVRD